MASDARGQLEEFAAGRRFRAELEHARAAGDERLREIRKRPARARAATSVSRMA